MNLARMQGYTHTPFERHPGMFNDHRESEPRFNYTFYSIVSVTILGC